MFEVNRYRLPFIKLQPLGKRQDGIAVLIVVFLISLAATGFLVSALNKTNSKQGHDSMDYQQLAQAKAALMGYAIGAIGALQRPGDLIRPDAASEATGNYDGSADSGCLDSTNANGLPLVSSGANMRCLGRFPWKDIGLSIDTPSENDPDGRMPWYAISANLVDPNCLTSLNSDTLNLAYTGYVCSGDSLPHPWLTVRDKLGNVLSNRVAAIILIPGSPIGNQSRPPSPNLGGANRYLDTITVTNSADCRQPHVAGTYSNAALNDDFIIADDARLVAEDDPCYQHPYEFNDKLIYITIDELMAEVEKRVAQEVKKVLVAYKTTNLSFPDAATIGYQGKSCELNASSGFLPLPICNCTGAMCDCAFPGTMTMTASNNYSAGLDRGGCNSAGSVCTCTGAGRCARTSSPARSFICTSTGTCTSNVAFTVPLHFTYQPTAPIDLTTMTGSASCSSGTTATCTGTGTVTTAHTCALPLLNPTNLPDWFTNNGWKHFIYYAKGNLTVGARNNVTSALITTGAANAGQNRPSLNLADYLDSTENTNANTTYDAVGTKRSSSYNDQMFIVAP